jgi:hypothetical protein
LLAEFKGSKRHSKNFIIILMFTPPIIVRFKSAPIDLNKVECPVTSADRAINKLRILVIKYLENQEYMKKFPAASKFNDLYLSEMNSPALLYQSKFRKFVGIRGRIQIETAKLIATGEVITLRKNKFNPQVILISKAYILNSIYENRGKYCCELALLTRLKKLAEGKPFKYYHMHMNKETQVCVKYAITAGMQVSSDNDIPFEVRYN